MADHPEVPAGVRRRLAPRLLSWFALHRRDLPWRHDRDPYRIWVSEVMLQQTQVATVVGFFTRFLTRFPTLADLAAADEQEVLRLWQGLGYYRRARDLLAAAKLLATSHPDGIPDDPAALAGLPGMGQYTRNAVLSQAFDRRLPILEVNSARVLSRLLIRPGDPRKNPARTQLWRDAESVLPREQVGDFNQALMELGAIVCTPKSPRCDVCPLSDMCAARRDGVVDTYPQLDAKQAITDVREVAVIVRRGEKILLVQRPDKGRWASMWEFPHGQHTEGDSAEAAATLLVSETTGFTVTGLRHVETLKHGITRYRVVIECLEGDYGGGEFVSATYPAHAWVSPDEAAAYPISSPQRRLVQGLTNRVGQQELFG